MIIFKGFYNTIHFNDGENFLFVLMTNKHFTFRFVIRD